MDLPEEIIVEILTRLPSKSLCKFKSVSNPFRTLISDPQFVKTHLNLHKTHRKLILLSRHSRTLFSVPFADKVLSGEEGDEDMTPATKIDFTSGEFPGKCSKVWGSCHGLVLVNDDENSQFLLNPSTGVSHKLPPDSMYNWIMGFGYDSCSDDYKVVKISTYDFWSYGWEEDTYISVYSMKTGSWRNFKNPPCDYSFYWHSPGAFVNGSLHWLAHDFSGPVIVAFSLADERFGEVLSLPSLPQKSDIFSYNLTAVDGCLCLVFCCKSGEINVWVMKEYGVSDSWTKLKVGSVDVSVSAVSPCYNLLLRDGEVMLAAADGKRFVVCNPKGNTTRDVVVHGIPDGFEDWGVYVESVVSPKVP